MKGAALLFSSLVFCHAAFAAGMSPTDAFNAGTTFGKDNINGVKGQINSTKASGSVPNYTSTSPESSYYQGGKGNLNAPASGQVQGCTSTSGASDPDAFTHGKCESVRMIMNDPGKKSALYPINKNTDPLMTKRNTVRDNVQSYLGSATPTGSYSACTEKTTTRPDQYITESCTQYLSAGEESCNEILTVSVKTSESCVPGTWYGGFKLPFPIQQVDIFCDMNRADGMIRLRFTPYELHGVCSEGYLDVRKAPFTVSDKVQYGVTGRTCTTDGCWDEYGYLNYEVVTINHWKGKCTVQNFIGYEPGYIQGCSGDTCSYTFRAIDWRWHNQAVATAGFTPPKRIVTETDFWDNRCAALETRLP